MTYPGNKKNCRYTLTTCYFLLCIIIYISPVHAENFSKTELNDTGINWSGNHPTGNNQDCNKLNTDKNNTSDMQDCSQGRDVNFPNDTDGLAGFAYQKISASGEPLSANAKEWHCVLDTVSGLMWESKSKSDGIIGSSGLSDSDDQFTWYSSQSKNNGGKIGNWNRSGKDCSGYIEGKPVSFCHTEQFTSRVNKQGLCGYSDWKIPTRTQLTSLINFGRTEPSIDPHYFPNTNDGFYWSATPVVNRMNDAWAQNFQFGFASPMRRTDKLYVRLVRENMSRDMRSRESNTREKKQ